VVTVHARNSKEVMGVATAELLVNYAPVGGTFTACLQVCILVCVSVCVHASERMTVPIVDKCMNIYIYIYIYIYKCIF
jgi:hypothetical protein